MSPPPKRTYIYKIANLSGLARSVETSKFHCLNEHVLLGARYGTYLCRACLFAFVLSDRAFDGLYREHG